MELAFFASWGVYAVALIRVIFLIRLELPEVYRETIVPKFNPTAMDDSISFIRFTQNSENWPNNVTSQTRFWLRTHQLISRSFVGFWGVYILVQVAGVLLE